MLEVGLAFVALGLILVVIGFIQFSRSIGKMQNRTLGFGNLLESSRPKKATKAQTLSAVQSASGGAFFVFGIILLIVHFLGD